MKTDCYCTSVRAASRRITARYDAALLPTGVNVAQWGLLRRLDPGSSISIKELADRAELERSTVARNLRVLEKDGFVQLGASEGDRRAANIALTDKGVAALKRGEPLWQQAQAEIEQQLGSAEARDLRSLLLSL
jgi:DNA-binding MarR family transcriptional regulator